MTEPRLDPAVDYPLGVHRPELIFTPTGKTVDDLTMDRVMAGDIAAEDLRITPEVLRLQAEIAEEVGRPQLGANLRRAAEMTALSDTRVLEIYNALRPGVSTQEELLSIAEELETEYSAEHLAVLVREAVDVYERREYLAVPE
ncbi:MULTISPECIES: diol dehydratase small subunit [Dietzia]|uniref:diol dehydratase small subunit n=1 Tax=Dietzia TaxID=37914 RepID=UPI00223B9A45|nr:diol dehydratase small subunit [Dietzia cinnamea]MCT2299844.1 diol dehydratase small subunit [Dietzia cinnamea]